MPFVFDWATLGSANGSAAIVDGANSTTLTVASSAGVFYSGFLGGNLFVQNVTTPRTSTVTFTEPVKNATFEILDLDASAGNWDDQVTIQAFDINGDPVAVIFSNLAPYHVQTGNTVEADGNSSVDVNGPGAPDSITVSFGGPVATIIVTFDNGPDFNRTGAIGFGDISGDVVCFTAGTLIETGDGVVDVALLTVGDMVRTLDHGLQPIRWIGRRTVQARDRFAPICIGAHRFGNARDLLLSPQHRLLIQGPQAEILFGEEAVLVAAKHLVGSDGVWRQPGGEVTYFHLLFDRHEVIFAEGIPCESYYPGNYSVAQMDTAQQAELFALFPELSGVSGGYGPVARPTLQRAEGQLLASLV